ncbi:hypothetical protein OPIT5_13585 [Opitutaceae bacterium TAV5]|nr:hypothetical protein OPIT5_13585 [Opitutaceae bacterium TAV5]
MPDRSAYKPVFTDSAVEFFVRLTKRKQRTILDRSHELAADPFLLPDFQTIDASGREISHLVIDNFIFDFWVDHAAKQVVITEIDRVE